MQGNELEFDAMLFSALWGCQNENQSRNAMSRGTEHTQYEVCNGKLLWGVCECVS